MADEVEVIDEWQDGRKRYGVVDCAEDWPRLAFRRLDGEWELAAAVSPIIVRRLSALLAERRQESEPEAEAQMAHDPAVHPFEATYLPGYGWVVLLPWVRTTEGYWWRPHFQVDRVGVSAEEMAKHYARELNEWRDTHAALAEAQIEAARRMEEG